MALAMNTLSLIIFIFIGNIIIQISGSDQANEGLKLEKLESRRSSLHMSAENGEINGIDPALIPEECRNMGICETIPVGLELNDISSIDKSEKDKYIVDEHQIHEHRVGDNDTVPLCEAVKKTFKPYLGNANDGLWYRILNSENENIQTYNGVYCRRNGENCRTIVNVLRYLLNEPPICTQNYIWRKMAYVVKNKKFKDEIKHDKKFQIPISCTCKRKLRT